MRRRLLALAMSDLLALAMLDFAVSATLPNVLWVVVDNLRPALGAYGVVGAVTPRIDALASNSTLFTRAFCQEAWCSPSRNSFLTGRRLQQTLAWNFLDDFRRAGDGTPGPGADWVTLPQYFKENGYYATSSGKIFHHNLPRNYDYPASWSDQPVRQNKYHCPSGAGRNNSMTCGFNASIYDYDYDCASLTIERLKDWSTTFPNHTTPSRPFFSATGFQGPRLPWSYPLSVLPRLPRLTSTRVAANPTSPLNASEDLEWFRPVEIAWYTDVLADGGITHSRPLAKEFQQLVRQGYYATITHVDDQVGRLLDAVSDLGVDDTTVIVFTADHGQNLGEENMWSMMNLLETSLRVPLMIRPAKSIKARAKSQPPTRRLYTHPVELLDLYPTLVGLAGLPTVPAGWNLPGTDLSIAMLTNTVVKPENAAFGQITRCYNCSAAYDRDLFPGGCVDDAVDAERYTVPCQLTPRIAFDIMGLTIRTGAWRYSLYCKWDGKLLQPDLDSCPREELFDHRDDTALYDVDSDSGAEHRNVATDPANAAAKAVLLLQLRRRFE